MTSEQTNTNEARALEVAEVTRAAKQAMAVMEQKEHKMQNPD